MVASYDPQTLYDFIVGDFHDAWDALAAVPDPAHRGNFMFGRQAMVLLEWASRLCMSDASGTALRDFADELQRIEPRYFTVLPGTCASPGEFVLPSAGHPDRELIHLLFDLIRHGQGHQYQQIVADLADGHRLAVRLYGARQGRTLASVLAAGRPVEHLAFRRDSDGDLELHVRPEVLFSDIDAAIKAAHLLGRGLTFKHLERPRTSGSPHYRFPSAALESALHGAGHPPVPA